MKHYFFILIIGCLASCEREYLSLDDNSGKYDPNHAIEISPVAEQKEQNSVSRGTPIVNVSQMTDIGVYCSYTGSSSWSSQSALGKMVNKQLERNTSTGRWEYEDGIVNWNAVSSTDKYSFFAYAPYATSQNGITVQGTSATLGIPSLTYTVPVNTASQPDLMLAVPRYNLQPSTSMVSLQMKHALTCIGFQVQGNGEKIKSLTLSNIYSRGQAKVDGNAINWTPLNQPSNFSPLLNYDAGQSYYTATTTMSTNLLPGNGYLMMIPQTLQSNTQLTITFSDNSTRSIDISGSWVAGKKITYNIIITPQGIITITPATILIPQLGASLQTENLLLSCSPSNMNWSIVSSDSWLQITSNPAGTNLGQIVSGQGNATIYTVIGANTSAVDRTATITIRGQTPIVVLSTITQLKQILPSAVGNGTRLAGVTSYTGAFWRAAQVGERIIRIPVGTDPYNLGTWTASVIWQDSNWSLGDVMFSTEPSADPGVSFILLSAIPGDAESYKMTDNTSIVSGTVGANGTIFFRIGLRSQFIPTPTIPARYAVIALNYNNRTKTQLIFVRQGESADYLMRPTDAATGSYVNATRPLARKFLCYNLTSPWAITWTGGVLIANHPEISYKGAAITEFPTQAGAMFQWAITDTPRRVIHPINPELLPITGWSNSYDSRYWTEGASLHLSESHDVCPDGYRRINDGAEDIVSDLKASKSELRQSLCATLTDGVASISNNNSVIGYYADGFFDRRCNTLSSSSLPGSAVSYIAGVSNLLNTRVAYVGTLIYNPNNWASLFFPSAGVRVGLTSTPGVPIGSAGGIGYYWTSSSLSRSTGIATTVSTGITLGNNVSRSTAMSIRCIKVP